MTRTIAYENLLNIIAKAPGHFYWKDTKGVYQGSNDAQAIFLGYKFGKDLIGKTDFDLPWKEQASYLQQIDRQVMATQKEYSVEEIVDSYKGVKTIFFSRKIPLYDPKTKKVIGIIGSSLDITASKQAEIAKQEFLMNMAHDLRTPLAGIIGLANIQTDKKMDHQEQQQYGQWIHSASEQLLELLNAVLKVIDTEQMTDLIKTEPIHLTQLAKELQALMQPSIEAKKLEFELKLDTCLPTIIGDQVKMKRLLLNLLANAVKFTKEGKISLEIALLSIDEDRAKIEIRVTDTGIGIGEDKINKIFDRFYRAHPSYQAEYTGYGIGLYLVKKTIELLGGEIRVSSEEGKGSCFSLEFNFPLAKENIEQTSPITAQQSISQPEAGQRMGSVLVAEDNALVLYAVKNILVNSGYQVTAVTKGKSALHALQTQSFVWALLDLGLPDLSGTEVVQQYRQWAQETNKPHLPIFALTAHAEGKIKQKCKEAGIDYVLHKPFTENDIQAVKKFLAK
jgi:two-component system, OmpR family, aerobic respiration control sensor histidine kinase ArcB